MSSITGKKNSITHFNQRSYQPSLGRDEKVALNPTLRLIKSLADSGEYCRALDVLSKSSMEPEIVNCRGVCLIRQHQFVKAVGLLRMVVLNSSTLRLHQQVAEHIKINFAIALFFGGEPGGGLSALAEIKAPETDPSVLMLRRQTKIWVDGLSMFGRLNWYLNRASSGKGPLPPDQPIGRFIWDLNNQP